jgi:HSP20 family molecular chaperone IbpA
MEDKEWEKAEDSLKQGLFLANGKDKKRHKFSIRTYENKGVFQVDVKDCSPDGLSADVEGGYLCIRERRGGLARIIPGKVLKKVYLPDNVSLEKVVARRSAGVLQCRLARKNG